MASDNTKFFQTPDNQPKNDPSSLGDFSSMMRSKSDFANFFNKVDTAKDATDRVLNREFTSE